MRRFLPIAFFGVLGLSGAAHGRFIAFTEPIDGLSLHLSAVQPEAVVRVNDNGWTAWQTLQIENEQDPELTESNLTVFDHSVTMLQILDAPSADVHPIRVSHTLAVRNVASTQDVGKSRILTREEWGADDSLLYAGKKASSSSSTEDASEKTEGSAPLVQSSGRVTDCLNAQRDYPDEFKIANIVKTSPDGKTYRWPLQYSPEIRLLVVHHTAMGVGTDPRPAVERVRALYEFHSENRGWGDIGYNYVIDETGQIYEGRQGGDNVIGGHAYCNNVGTLGIAMLGNFDTEEPTQEQIEGLQWLLHNLADHYNIPLDRKIRFHGKTLPTVVGHRDVVSTECPGYYAYNVLPQVRDHIRDNLISAPVTFPKIIANTEKLVKKTDERKEKRLERVVGGRSTGPIDRRLAAKLKSQTVGALRRTLRNRVEDAGGTPRPTSKITPRVTVKTSTKIQNSTASGTTIRIHLTTQDSNLSSCSNVNLDALQKKYRGTVSCLTVDGKPTVINELPLEDYLRGLSEEPDTEPIEKQKAFAIAARSYAAFYMDPAHRKFPGKPYDGSDSPAEFQAYGGIAFEDTNGNWVDAVEGTSGEVLTVNSVVIKAPYFSSDSGRTRSPADVGWTDFPHAEIFSAKDDPWCKGMALAGHGVGMSGCGAEGQALEGKTAEQILQYYYPGTGLVGGE